MIIVHLMGGLGNQLFQYALGRAMAILRDTELKLDIFDYSFDKRRVYQLSSFKVKEAFATEADLRQVLGGSNLSRRLHGIIDHFVPHSMRRKLEEQFLRFEPRVFECRRDVYFSGYWQCEKYFVDQQSIIREELAFKFPPTGFNRQLADEIENGDSISVHIRRGDYVSNPVVKQMMAQCTFEYYSRCMSLLAERVRRPIFYLFSDDPQWVKREFKSTLPVRFVDHNGCHDAQEDFRLMTLCKHNIIANSTFSWWAAWLNGNKHKNVCAPKIWFQDSRYEHKDIIPPTWITVEN